MNLLLLFLLIKLTLWSWRSSKLDTKKSAIAVSCTQRFVLKGGEKWERRIKETWEREWKLELPVEARPIRTSGESRLFKCLSSQWARCSKKSKPVGTPRSPQKFWIWIDCEVGGRWIREGKRKLGARWKGVRDEERRAARGKKFIPLSFCFLASREWAEKKPLLRSAAECIPVAYSENPGGNRDGWSGFPILG